MKKTKGYIGIAGHVRGEFDYKLVDGFVADVGMNVQAFVHRDLFPEGGRPSWCVTERTSGMFIAKGTTRASAVDNARDVLRKVGKETAHRVIRSSIDRYKIKVPEITSAAA